MNHQSQPQKETNPEPDLRKGSTTNWYEYGINPHPINTFALHERSEDEKAASAEKLRAEKEKLNAERDTERQRAGQIKDQRLLGKLWNFIAYSLVASVIFGTGYLVCWTTT